ncbi:MAG: hypothetical protein AAFQ65_08585, partial [Myxococcota bacterium]
WQLRRPLSQKGLVQKGLLPRWGAGQIWCWKHNVSWLCYTDPVQVVSLFLESIGLSLALLENFAPEAADQLEEKIDEARESLRTIGRLLARNSLKLVRPVLWISVALAVLIVTPLQLFIMLSSLLPEASGFLVRETVESLVWIAMACVLIPWVTGVLSPLLVLSFAVPFAALSFVIARLNCLTSGRAIGGLGVVIASVGFVGEIYQVLSLALARCK